MCGDGQWCLSQLTFPQCAGLDLIKKASSNALWLVMQDFCPKIRTGLWLRIADSSLIGRWFLLLSCCSSHHIWEKSTSEWFSGRFDYNAVIRQASNFCQTVIRQLYGICQSIIRQCSGNACSVIFAIYCAAYITERLFILIFPLKESK